MGLLRELAKDDTFIEIMPNVKDDIIKGLKEVKKIRSGELPKRIVKQMLS